MKLIPLRYAGNCVSCGVRIEQRTEAWYDLAAKKVTCTNCRPTDAQMSVDAAAPDPTVSRVSARTDREKGSELERRISEVFAAAGYRTQTNVVLEGARGGKHEIDVLAEKSDGLLTFTVAVERKAWANPIEKAVVAKFDLVLRDLGIRHGVIVSLNGTRSGAVAAAEEFGIVLWGPNEIESHLGRTAVLDLQNRPMTEEIGFPRLLTDSDGEAIVARATAGRLGMGKEEIIWQGDAWIPVAVVQLNLMRMKLVGGQKGTVSAWAVYDLFAGTFLTRLEVRPQLLPVPIEGERVAPRRKVLEPARSLDQVIAKFDAAKSDKTVSNYRKQLAALGVPDFHTATTGDSSGALYPLHLAIARHKGRERIVAVDAFRSRLDDPLSTEMSKHMSVVRSALPAPGAPAGS